jgi:hypothetical protein
MLATAEGRPGAGVRRVCDQSRDWMRGLLADLATQAGAPAPDRLAQQLVLLYDGAIVGSRMDAAPEAAATARALASTIIDAAIGKRAR